MKTIQIITLFLASILLFSSCAPSIESLNQAVEGTLTAIANINTETPIKPSVTPTELPTQTSTPEPTPTFTPKPTPDLRVIDTDPATLLCVKADLPKEGYYKIPGQGWMSINTNDEVIQARGTTKGRDYIISTGRVTGWWVVFYRTTKSAQLPEQLSCGVYMFKTAEGAQLALEKYNSVESAELKSNEKYEYVDKNLDIGDKGISYVYYRLKKGGNREKVFSIEFTYKNLMIQVDGYSAVETDVKPEDLEKIALILLERVQGATLVNTESALWPSR
jgi:hypothetical protein